MGKLINLADKKILIYGFGNTIRQDDGLGIKFVEAFKNWNETQNSRKIEFETAYQLSIEDVLKLSKKEVVIFVDASRENIQDFLFTYVHQHPEKGFALHAASPSDLLHLCDTLHGATPTAYILQIKGYSWEITEHLTPQAESNMNKALEYMQSLLAA